MIARPDVARIDEHSHVLARIEKIVTDVVAPLAPVTDREGTFPAEQIAALAAGGVGGLLMPERLGGQGASTATYAEALEILPDFILARDH